MEEYFRFRDPVHGFVQLASRELDLLPEKWTLRFHPRKWQAEALREWKKGFRGIVKVVTGAGKTVLAETCMVAFREKYPEGRIVIIVPTIALLDQWFVSLTEELHVPDQEIACFSGEDKKRTPKPVNILVVNSARKLASKISGGKDSFLIVDECHRVGSIMNAQALRGKHRATLGLSATPERQYDEGFEKNVLPVLGPIVFTYDYRQGLHDRIVAPFELINVHVDMLAHERAAFDKLSRQAARAFARLQKEGGTKEHLTRILQRRAAVSSSAVMRIPVTAALIEKHKGKRTLVFHERIEAANSLLNIINSRKHSCTIYHSKIGPILRRDNLRLYRRGVFDILVTCRALDEGTNIPETTVAIIAASTASERQRIQRLGRVLRPFPGKKGAIIYTIYASKPEEIRLRKEAEALEGVTSVSWTRAGKSTHG